MRRFLSLSPSFLLAVAVLGQVPGTPAPAVPAPAAPDTADAPPAAMATITKKELLAHATWFASDELQGRMTGSPGQAMAADYIAKHLAALGLEPLGDEGEKGRGYLIHYPVRRVFVQDGSALKLGAVELKDGWAVLGLLPAAIALEQPLAFVGRGRTRGSEPDVAEDASLEGKIAVATLRAPRGRVDKQLGVEEKFMMSFQALGQIGRTVKNLEQKGASAVVFLMLDDPTGLTDVLNYLAVMPGKDVLAPGFEGGDNSMGAMAGMLSGTAKTPTFVLSIDASKRTLAALGLEAEAVAKYLGDDAAMPAAKADVGGRVAVDVVRDDKATATDVCAVLRGADPTLAAECVLFSSHMDHMGRRMDGAIFHGADDNASGSAAMLEIAEAFARSATKPKRSIVFLSVSGEELGLWGSEYYAAHPTWPLDKIVADVNTDMIGRSGPETGTGEVSVTPSHEHPMFSTIVQEAARLAPKVGLSCNSGDKYYQRSDHYNFAKRGIPVVFFCNGEHADYHQVTDTADKLEGDKMESVARLAFWTGWNTANADEGPRRLGRRGTW